MSKTINTSIRSCFKAVHVGALSKRASAKKGPSSVTLGYRINTPVLHYFLPYNNLTCCSSPKLNTLNSKYSLSSFFNTKHCVLDLVDLFGPIGGPTCFSHPLQDLAHTEWGHFSCTFHKLNSVESQEKSGRVREFPHASSRY